MVSSTQEPSPLFGKFYRGRIVRLRFGSQTGAIRSDSSGRVLPFRFSLVRLLGAQGFSELREGMTVGFDVGWTSSGLRVSVIKVSLPGEHPAQSTSAEKLTPEEEGEGDGGRDRD